MPQNLSVPNSVRSVAGISAQSTGALTELKKLKFVFGIQIVYFSEILRAKYPKLEYWSDENPSVITSRWRKRHFGITLFENTNFSTFKFSFKIPKTPPKIGTFQNQKTRGGENGMIFPGGENGISRHYIMREECEQMCQFWQRSLQCSTLGGMMKQKFGKTWVISYFADLRHAQ